jgi:hypothetical protein
MSIQPVCVLACVAALLSCAAARAQDEDVLHNPTPQDIEQIMRQMKFKYKKDTDKRTKNRYYYRFQAERVPVTLYYFQDGKQLMLQARLKKVSLKQINTWNDAALFTRAYLGSQGSLKDRSILEWNLDIQGAVTPNSVRHFFDRYLDELKKFAEKHGVEEEPGDTEPGATPEKDGRRQRSRGEKDESRAASVLDPQGVKARVPVLQARVAGQGPPVAGEQPAVEVLHRAREGDAELNGVGRVADLALHVVLLAVLVGVV